MNSTLLEAARKIAPVLADNAAATARATHPVPDNITVIREAGMFALPVPREAGGHDADPRTLVEVIAELGRGCASTAWVVAVSAGNKKLYEPMLPGTAQQALRADPHGVLCGSAAARDIRAERVPGGLRVSGKWAMASGSEVASWAVAGVSLDDGTPPTTCLTLLPMTDLTVERTWRAIGMEGTSSHTIVADDVFVPQEFFAELDPGTARKPLSFFSALGLLASMIGATHGALDVVATSITGDRKPQGTTYARVVDSPLGRHWFTEALRRAESAMQRALRVADLQALDPNVTAGKEERIRSRVEMATAAQECRESVELLLDLNGTGGFAQDHPLQRRWRDVAVGTRHPLFNSYILAEDRGRVFFDMSPTAGVSP
jgi:alkylation response protein AidB-like acyl-CoA dehydrogenase